VKKVSRLAISLLSLTGLSLGGLPILMANAHNAPTVQTAAPAEIAAPANCTCVTAPNAASTAALGNILLSNGDVLYTGADGFEPAVPGAPLVSGSQISVGIESSANISVGSTCILSIFAGSEVSISQPSGAGGDICVQVSEPEVAVIEPTTPPPAPAANNLLPLLVIGGGIGAAVALGGGDDSASN